MEYSIFPFKIRTASDVAHIDHTYRIAYTLAETLELTKERAQESIDVWMKMGDDQSLAMALGYMEYIKFYYPQV